MKYISYAIITLYLTLKSIDCLTVNKIESFLNVMSPNGPESLQNSDLPENIDDSPETKRKGRSGGIISTIDSVFRNKDKTTTKTQNNLVVLDLEDHKNIKNKKLVDVNYLEVQRSSSLFTNNTEKGVIRFAVNTNKFKNKGTINRATLKINKLFDGKSVGFNCPSNSLKLYMIQPLGDDLKVNIIKGPLKVEFKKNETEVDVTKFFEDLENDSSGSSPNLSGSESFLELLSKAPDNSDDIEFDDDSAGGNESDETKKSDDFFGDDDESNEEEQTNSRGGGSVDKYLMFEADPNCYFALDLVKNKPKVKIEMSKNVVFRTKGTYKVAFIGLAGLLTVLALGGLGFYIKNKRSGYYYYVENHPNEIISST